METVTKPFAAAIMHYFGKKPNQSNVEFLAELKALDAADRAWFIEHLAKVGVIVQEAH